MKPIELDKLKRQTRRWIEVGMFVVLLWIATVAHLRAQAPSRCDLNGDGSVTVADLQILSNVISGTQNCPTVSCDINLDGAIDTGDTDTLLQVILQTTSCPSC